MDKRKKFKKKRSRSSSRISSSRASSRRGSLLGKEDIESAEVMSNSKKKDFYPNTNKDDLGKPVSQKKLTKKPKQIE